MTTKNMVLLAALAVVGIAATQMQLKEGTNTALLIKQRELERTPRCRAVFDHSFKFKAGSPEWKAAWDLWKTCTAPI